jgi:uncharacterized membrane protein SpoIIM required for sporulation
MREATFLKQNEPKWREFEQILRNKEKPASADQLADLFVEVSNDLAYARTYYPDSKSVDYLNSLAAFIHLEIYKNKKERSNRLVEFFSIEVPLILADGWKRLLYSFIIFVVAIIIGALSTHYDENFLRMIVGDEYVNMTKDNIRNGVPTAVYGTGGELDGFFMIMINNIKVSFFAFVLGIFLSAGTAYLLFSNGIMVGAFFTFFYKLSDQWLDAWLSVMVHGSLELSAIAIAGMAGFELGNAVLFPGTYTRLESVRRGAIRGMKIVIVLMPVFVVAAFFESFVTRYFHMPAILKILIITLSFAYIIWYFVIYPQNVKERLGRA